MAECIQIYLSNRISLKVCTGEQTEYVESHFRIQDQDMDIPHISVQSDVIFNTFELFYLLLKQYFDVTA